LFALTCVNLCLGVLNDYALYKSTHSLTHSLPRIMCVLCPTRDCGVNDVLIVGFSHAVDRRSAHFPDGCIKHRNRGSTAHALPSQSTHVRDGHGLGPSMGWVGLGWVAFSSTCDGFGGLG